MIHKSLESNTKRHNLASYSTGHHEGMLEDDKLIEDQSMSTSNAKKRGSKKYVVALMYLSHLFVLTFVLIIF